MSSPAQLPDDLVTWIEQVAGGRLARADRQPGGARKEAWFVDVTRPDGTVDDLFLRYDRSDPTRTGDPWTLRPRGHGLRRAAGDRRAGPAGACCASRAGSDADRPRVDGRNWFSQIVDAEERTRTAQDFITHLAALHRLDPAAARPPRVSRADRPSRTSSATSSTSWTVSSRSAGARPIPRSRLALDWLRPNVPDYDGPPVLVQGDTGPGNFMYADGRVRRDRRLGARTPRRPDGRHRVAVAPGDAGAVHATFRSGCASTRTARGTRSTTARVHYYRVMAETKLQVMSAPGRCAPPRPGGGGGGVDTGSRLIYGVLHRRLWLEALARGVGIDARAESRSRRRIRRVTTVGCMRQCSLSSAT